MLLQPVARGSRRCSEKKKWEDASRDEINTAKQIANLARPALRSRDATTSIDASYKLSIDAGRKQDLTAPSMTVDVCGSERWARNFRVMRSIEDPACSTVSML